MAEAVVQIVLEKLSSLVYNKLGPFLSFHKELNRLSSTLTAIKATLGDAEEKQFTDRAINDWLKKLRDVAHMLDDTLDECATEALELEDGGLNYGLPGKFRISCLSSLHPTHVAFRCKIAKKMKMIRERLDEIAEERHKFHLNETVTDRRAGVTDWRQTTSIITQPQVYGREEEKNNIVDLLVGDGSNFEDLSVYPILGVGGLGKTTLAQLIFNHERVVKHFELRIWVCVSEDFSLKRMTKAIIESVSGHACEDMDLEPLRRRLEGMLQRKRYLLVLDDVWDHDQNKWQKLKYVLACGAKGASILVTTRLLKVAVIMGTVPPLELSMLSDNDCWELFKQRAFGPNEVEWEELVIIGKEIVNKCAGMPLAAIALGGFLRFKREEREWLAVKESKLWSSEEDPVLRALRLSYLNLPVRLRLCFVFCALFQKGERISKQFLFEIWMANGFISSNETSAAEDICNEVWEELFWRSFFQDTEIDEFGKIISFKMHDVVHDLAQSVAQDVCCIADDSGITSVPNGIRHLSINLEEVGVIQLCQVQSLRTCILRGFNGDQLSPRVWKCSSLRVLHCEGLENLPTSIGRLKYLRYLNISHSSFKTLPEALCGLRNLQVLNLEYCTELQMLPNGLKRLKALQHLCLRQCNSLPRLAPSIGELTLLRRFESVYCCQGKRVPFVRIGLPKAQRRTPHQAFGEGNYCNKCRRSQSGGNEEPHSTETAEQILEVLQPHAHHLQTLRVGGYPGAQFPQWMASPSFKVLSYVLLVDCKNCLNLPPLGKLPYLKRLGISNMNHVQCLDDESYDGNGFMVLEFLILEKLPNLKRLSWERKENTFPRLCVLQINECPELTLPCLPSLQNLDVMGRCEQSLLSSIHNSPSLEFLALYANEELTCFPDVMLQDLTSLRGLTVNGHSGIEILPTGNSNLGAVQQLVIVDCNSLESLSNEVLQALHSLKVLKIFRSLKFKFTAGFQCLSRLEELEISECPAVEGFPEALQPMTALRSLTLRVLPNLRSLPDWLGNHALLESLILFGCPELTYLPMSIQSLGNLRRLTVVSCPGLQEQCGMETEKDGSQRLNDFTALLEFSISCLLVMRPSSFIENEQGI